MIICLSVLGFVFFRTANEYVKLGIFLCLFGGLVAFGFSIPNNLRAAYSIEIWLFIIGLVLSFCSLMTRRVKGTSLWDIKLREAPLRWLLCLGILLIVFSGASLLTTPAPQPTSPEATLPTFFPPKATATVLVPLHLIKDGISLGELAERLGNVMDSVGYVEKSFYSLDAVDNKGCAIVTHIEQIKADGTPFAKGRWSFKLPSYENFSVALGFLSIVPRCQPPCRQFDSIRASPDDENVCFVAWAFARANRHRPWRLLR
jgi:hypothetical protein